MVRLDNNSHGQVVLICPLSATSTPKSDYYVGSQSLYYRRDNVDVKNAFGADGLGETVSQQIIPF